MAKFNGTIYIEFNGIPGCGKTTLANQCIEYLKKQGFTVANLSLDKTNYQKRRFRKWINRMVGILFYYPFIIEAIKIKPFNIERIKYVLEIYDIIHLSQDNTAMCADFILVDQGIVQGIASIFHTTTYYPLPGTRSSVNKHLRSFENAISINCNITASSAIERIRDRKANLGRFDQMDDSNLEKSYNINMNNLAELRKSFENEFQSIEIETETPTINNTNKILRFVSDLLDKEVYNESNKFSL